MSHAALPILLLTLGAGADAPQSVALQSEIDTWRARAVAEDVATFVQARMQEAWSLPPPSDRPQFSVRLRWPGPERVEIRIQEGDRVWVDRPLPVDDPSAARAMVWLLVRSTVERALLHARASAPPADPTPPIPRTPGPPAVIEVIEPAPPPPAPAPAPVAPAAPEGPAKVELVEEDAADWLAGPPKAAAVETTTVAEAGSPLPTPTATTAGPDTSSAHADLQATGLKRLLSAPLLLGPNDAVELAVMMSGFADPSSGFGWGPSVQARLQFESHLVVGAGIGYRAEHKSDDLRVNHVPITVLAGYRFSSLPLEIGAAATFDTRILNLSVVEAGNQVDTTGVTAGVLVGVYARGFYGLWKGQRAELRLFGEITANFGVVRSAYVVASGREEDAVVTFGTGAGLEWRWR